MIRETFDSPAEIKTPATDKTYSSGFQSDELLAPQGNINPFSKTLEEALKIHLKPLIAGNFSVTALPEECLSYANLKDLAPGRSYFSLFSIDQPENVWVLHLDRSVGEGLAHLVAQQKKSHKHAEIFTRLREADAMVFLEIGVIQRNIFDAMLSNWPMLQGMRVVKKRHVLQLNRIAGVDPSEECVIQPFLLKHSECQGLIHLVFPHQYSLFT